MLNLSSPPNSGGKLPGTLPPGAGGGQPWHSLGGAAEGQIRDPTGFCTYPQRKATLPRGSKLRKGVGGSDRSPPPPTSI